MLRLEDKDWAPVDVDLQVKFYDWYFVQIFELLELEKPALENDIPTALIRAIREGTVTYAQGVFSGTYSAKISKELSQFATFDGRTKQWKGLAPPNVAGVAAVANAHARALNEKIASLIPRMYTRVEEVSSTLSFPIRDAMARWDAIAEKDIANIKVLPEMTQAMQQRLYDAYTNNQQLNIKNWNEDQVTRLREAVERNAKQGYNRLELEDFIRYEWNVTRNKARFLARQESSLFLSTFRDERYMDAGITTYRWSSSHDSRCREANRYGGPAHGPGGPLDGHVFEFGNPPVSGPKGERQAPGVPFGCRCVAVPLG